MTGTIAFWMATRNTNLDMAIDNSKEIIRPYVLTVLSGPLTLPIIKLTKLNTLGLPHL